MSRVGGGGGGGRQNVYKIIVTDDNSADSADASSETVYARAPLIGRTFCLVNTPPE